MLFRSKDAFPYSLGYWQGRACGHFENGTYENMSDRHKYLYKLGFDNGVIDYGEMDAVNHDEEKPKWLGGFVIEEDIE